MTGAPGEPPPLLLPPLEPPPQAERSAMLAKTNEDRTKACIRDRIDVSMAASGGEVSQPVRQLLCLKFKPEFPFWL
jgi:hypothetical protein